MGKIVAFDGKWKSGTPASVVDLLEKTLACALNGDIESIFIATVGNDELGYDHAGESWGKLLAAVEAGKFGMLMEAERG